MSMRFSSRVAAQLKCPLVSGMGTITLNEKHQTFRLGDMVRIRSGPFVSFTGKIDGINQSKALLLVKVVIYGRTEPIRLKFADVEFGNIRR